MRTEQSTSRVCQCDGSQIFTPEPREQVRLQFLLKFGGQVDDLLSIIDLSQKLGPALSSVVKTTIDAESQQQATVLLVHLYGEGNVLSITQGMTEDGNMTEETKILSPQDLQVKALADKAKQATQQKKKIQATQAMLKAQEKMRDVSKT